MTKIERQVEAEAAFAMIAMLASCHMVKPDETAMAARVLRRELAHLVVKSVLRQIEAHGDHPALRFYTFSSLVRDVDSETAEVVFSMRPKPK